MSTFRTDFSNIETRRIGSGTFGAKTTELTRFKDLVERHGVIVPPHISFPIEIFMAALIRAGLLNELGAYTHKRNGTVKLTKEERKFLADALEPLNGFMLAVRSDEHNAKGSGVFSTKLVSFNNVYNAVETVLSEQFSADANAFKRLTGAPHGIGIQIMPLCGETFNCLGERYHLPPISISGLTVLEQEQVRLAAGCGFGGGVSVHSSLLRYQNNGTNGMSVKPEQSLEIMAVDLNCTYVKRVEPALLELGHFPDGYTITQCIIEMAKKILEMAKELGKDIYFELQCIDHKTNLWAITQITEHTWPLIIPPEGTEVVRVEAANRILGSGIQRFSEYVVLPDAFEMLLQRINAVHDGIMAKHPDALVVFRYLSKGQTIARLENVRAILDTGLHSRPPISHIGGVFRETGKILINSGVNSRYLDGKEFAVWADEKNDRGGIVLI